MFFSANDTSAYPSDILYIHFLQDYTELWMSHLLSAANWRTHLWRMAQILKTNKQGITLQIGSKIRKSNMLAQGLAR
jgi:hypothetical protein